MTARFALAWLLVVPTALLAEEQPPIDIVFKIHLEPQSTREAYRKRRDDVEAVRAIAEAHGARLSIHGNGEFWEYSREEGDAPLVRAWIAAGHHVGVHMHSVYRRGPHDWPQLPTAQQTADRIRSLWQDHSDALRTLVPEHAIQGATPFGFEGGTFDTLMQSFGFSILGGGRHEIASDLLGHPPFNPWRPGAAGLEEDLSNRDYLIVFHCPQITEAKPHGPQPGTFQDATVAHLQVEFLQVLLEREREARTGGVAKRWLFGFLTHDNQSPAETRAEIERLFTWLDPFVRAGQARYASFDEVAASFLDWEARHPGVSSFHYQAGDPYPYSFPALASALHASSSQVVDLLGSVELGSGTSAYRLLRGTRSGTEKEELLLAWRAAGSANVDLSALWPGSLRVMDGASGREETASATAVPVGPDPVLVRR
ncbi:MAG TPA: hypothetical protein VJU18_01185 [Vicinamibacteria bacterium]|nr:hypothetical protein [Vicinamibacteria bacterium]